MKRLLFIIPLLLIGSALHMPSVAEDATTAVHTEAEQAKMKASKRIVEDWSARYVGATTLEGDQGAAMYTILHEIDTTDLPYQTETITRLKAYAVESISRAIEKPNHNNLTEGFRSIERLGDELEVNL